MDAKEKRIKTYGDEKMIYCRRCGNKIYEDTEICPSCGVRQIYQSNKVTKNKTTALLLAVFLSFWTWCYTYKKDAAKFWTGLLICIFLFWIFFIPVIIVWIWSIIDVASKDNTYYNNF